MTAVKQEPESPSPAKASITKSAEKTAISVKRPTKKKPKDKPKRHLSAYNFFFKEMREKVLKVVTQSENDTDTINEPDSDEYIDTDTLKRLKKEGGKVSFEEMGKLIGTRWKNLQPDRLTKYSELAANDTDRYKEEMKLWNGKQEAKMRSEAAMKPQAVPYPSEDPKSAGERGPPHYDMQQGYGYGGYAYPPEYGYHPGYYGYYAPPHPEGHSPTHGQYGQPPPDMQGQPDYRGAPPPMYGGHPAYHSPHPPQYG